MITTEQMKALEEQANKQGITNLDLMENAGKQVFLAVKERKDLVGKHILIFAGQGNNGGDGFVAARHFQKEYMVTVFFFGDEEKLTKEASKSYDKIKDAVINIKEKKDLELFKFQKSIDFVLIDALLGTGVKGEPREPISFGIDLFNSLEGYKVAIDMPSANKCQVDLIICLHDLKEGVEKEKAIVVDIGIPNS